ncbi:hypothetical protein [Alteriqipengyuania lutimaris]|uniref:Histidine kinase n=1 Tax=Alteriqipengyuania lutimaris TaxID=1538146 RepID=A0A395LGF7_9SPHN|nr:hypothetical protein [Alteriqipengyuania lutimaris]MBB3035397.1 hypothetical protein [Alteriqipengyuania lutimaris]RDS75978.1 hypothetical protein DL238_15010 [Alteriqipengyuania lutimaris]
MDDDAAKALTKLLGDQIKMNVRVLRLLVRTVEQNEDNEEQLRDIADAVADMLPEYARMGTALKGFDDGD